MIHKIIKQHISDKDYIYGFVDIRGLLQGRYSDYKYGIVIGRKLDKNIINEISDGPTEKYYQHYRKFNKELKELADVIAQELSEVGIPAISTEPSLGGADLNNYSKTLSLDISHKMLATRAGLGWIGKTALFISDKFGPRLRLVSILTKETIDFCQSPVTESKCGDCNICVIECPAEASNGKLWNTSIYRDEFFNPFLCREMCRKLGESQLGHDAHICGICVSVCPYGI